MENASKTIIKVCVIILLVPIILAVSLAMVGTFLEYQMTEKTMNIGMTEYDNTKFTKYEGTISGIKAKELCDLIEEHNALYIGDPTKQVSCIEIAQDAKATDTSKIGQGRARKAYIKVGLFYNVTIGYDTSTGLVSNIGIQVK